MKKIRFNAKSVPKIKEAEAKLNAGFRNIEIQLIHPFVSEDEYEATEKMIKELGADISVVHTPLIKDVCEEVALDQLLVDKYYNYFKDTCKYAEYISQIENKRIKVVIHNTFSKFIWEETNLIPEKIAPRIKAVLDEDPHIDLVVENSIFFEKDMKKLRTIFDLSDVAYTVNELNKVIGNRALPLIDTCHSMMNAVAWKKITGDETLNWDDVFAKATKYNKLGLIHLNNMWIDGIDKDHGVGFFQSHDGDIEKLTKIMQAYEKYADCEITIEVREDNYLSEPTNLLETEKSLNFLGFEQI